MIGSDIDCSPVSAFGSLAVFPAESCDLVVCGRGKNSFYFPSHYELGGGIKAILDRKMDLVINGSVVS